MNKFTLLDGQKLNPHRGGMSDITISSCYTALTNTYRRIYQSHLTAGDRNEIAILPPSTVLRISDRLIYQRLYRNITNARTSRCRAYFPKMDITQIYSKDVGGGVEQSSVQGYALIYPTKKNSLRMNRIL